MSKALVRCCLVWFFAVLTVAAAEQSHADKVVEQLRAANVARSSLATEIATWKREKQRLKLLISEAQRQIQIQETGIAQNNTSIEQIQKRLVSLNNQAHSAAEIDGVLLELSTYIQETMAKRAAVLPSGSVPKIEQDPAAEASMQFLRTVALLKQAAASSKQWRAHLSSGMLNGQRIAYDQISMGHVAAWWLSRDQRQAGIVERKNGINILHEVKDPAIIQAITTAIAIAHGDRAPEPVLLPLDQRQLTTAQAVEQTDE